MKDTIEIKIKADSSQAVREIDKVRRAVWWLKLKTDWPLYVLLLIQIATSLAILITR